MLKQQNALTKSSQNALFIFNPVSGVGDHNARKKHILSIAKQKGWRGKLIETSLTQGAATIAKDAIKRRITRLVVCGGDGTIMEVLQSVVKKRVVVGIVPLGTGNLLAKNLDLPVDIEKAVVSALIGKATKVDIGRANNTYFAIMAGIGLDTDIMKETDRTLKEKVGFLAYVWGAIKSINRRSGEYSIVIDNQPEQIYKAKSIIVANMGEIQGNIKVVPHAKPQNGTLRIGIIQASNFNAWISLIVEALRGNINKSKHYTLLTGKSISITVLRGKKQFQCDGDIFPPTKKLLIHIIPHSVSIATK